MSRMYILDMYRPLRVEDVAKIVQESPQNLLTLARYFDKLRVAKVNLHIRN